MARNYWRIPKEDPGHQLFLRRYRFAVEQVRGAGIVYDAACGYGTGTQMLADVCQEAIGLDVDGEAIQAAQQLNQRENLLYERVDFEKSETWEHWRQPLPDWVVSLETHEHLRFPTRWVERIQHLAREGIVLSRPIVPVTHKAGNYSDATAADIDSWFKDWGVRVAHEYHQEKWEGKLQDVYYIAAYRRKGVSS